jgi:hypothetical protein
VYVWPFHKLLDSAAAASTDEVVSLIVQLEIETTTAKGLNGGSRQPKFKSEDRYIIGVIAQVFSATFERINTMKQAEDSMARTYSILQSCKLSIVEASFIL